MKFHDSLQAYSNAAYSNAASAKIFAMKLELKIAHVLEIV